MRPVLALMRHRLRRLCWIACLAIFGLALVPTLSHAFAHAQGQSVYTEICTPQGMKRIALGDDGSGPLDAAPAAAASHLDHCPLCGLGSSPPLAPSSAAIRLAPLALSQPVPALFLHAPRPLFAWAAAQPRAPPAQA